MDEQKRELPFVKYPSAFLSVLSLSIFFQHKVVVSYLRKLFIWLNKEFWSVVIGIFLTHELVKEKRLEYMTESILDG